MDTFVYPHLVPAKTTSIMRLQSSFPHPENEEYPFEVGRWLRLFWKVWKKNEVERGSFGLSCFHLKMKAIKNNVMMNKNQDWYKANGIQITNDTVIPDLSDRPFVPKCHRLPTTPPPSLPTASCCHAWRNLPHGIELASRCRVPGAMGPQIGAELLFHHHACFALCSGKPQTIPIQLDQGVAMNTTVNITASSPYTIGFTAINTLSTSGIKPNP